MQHTLGGFKIAAKIGPKGLKVAYKKGAFLYTVLHLRFRGLVGEGFIFGMEDITTHVTLRQDGIEQYYLEISQPSRQETIKVYPYKKEDFDFFMNTDYNGYFINPKL